MLSGEKQRIGKGFIWGVIKDLISQGLIPRSSAAGSFIVDMSLTEEGICRMLYDYEQDWHTGMDIKSISRQIYSYTSGYPFLVSRLCKLLDEQVAGSAGSKNQKYGAHGCNCGLSGTAVYCGNEDLSWK